MAQEIPGYEYGDESLPEAPYDEEDLEKLQAAVLFDEGDEEALREAGEVLEPQIEEILDLWYDFVGANDHLVYYFTDGEGNPDEEYLDRVRARFGQWIRDTCNPPYDQEWLNYQYEIGRRHTRDKKNRTDDADAVSHIHARYLIAFIYPITATIREFLENGEHSEEEVDAMFHAWFKSVTLQVTLWTQPYVRAGDW
jgi:Protoglobin